MWEDGTLHLCDDVEITTVTRGDDSTTTRSRASCARADPTASGEFSGEVAEPDPAAQPRQAPDGNGCMTRISEGMTRNGRSSRASRGRGYGLSEYLDQIIDGAPVGLAE